MWSVGEFITYLKGGTVTEAGGAELAFTTSGGTLAGVTFDNNLDLASLNGAYATITGGLTLAAGGCDCCRCGPGLCEGRREESKVEPE